MQFENVTYIVRFVDKSKGLSDVTIQGIRALAWFKSDDLYTVEGLNGRQLTDAEIDLWENLADEAYKLHGGPL